MEKKKDELLHPLGFDRCTSGIRARARPTELPEKYWMGNMYEAK
jgi:hypothetical protein